MTTARKYGRLPARFPAGLRDLAHYAEVNLPAPPASVTVPTVVDWGMDANDAYGDCGVAGLNHGFMATASDAAATEGFPTDSEITSYYLTYTGGQDSGVVLSDFLAYVRKAGFYGHTVAAYAPVPVSDTATLQFAVDAFDFAYCGITVTEAMEQAFGQGKPWTPDLMDSPVAGGHCVPVVGYDATSLYCITWGTVQAITYPAWSLMAQEAWAVLTGEIETVGNDGHGIALAALQADLNALAPQPPAPAEPPAPVPPEPDHKGLLSELAALVREVEADAMRDSSELIAFLSEHGL